MGFWAEKQRHEEEDKLEAAQELLEEALKIMRRYHDAQMKVAKQAGPEDIGDIDVELIIERASAGAAICQFYRENS